MIYIYLPLIFQLSAVILIALISPGPDFAIVVRNSLKYSRKIGIYTALGVALGNLVHISYCLLGLGIAIKENANLFIIIKYLSASYLFYIGFKGICAKKSNSEDRIIVGSSSDITENNISILKALSLGFLTTLLNPKAILFYISLFSVMVPSTIPSSAIFIISTVIVTEAFIWFSFVAICLSNKKIRTKFYNIDHWVDRVIGIILISLSIKLLFTKF